MNLRIFKSSVWRSAVCLLAAVLVLAFLTACSDQIYDPSQGELILDTGTGTSGGNGNLELPTEAPTGGMIVMPSTDPFENSPHVLRADFLDTGDSDVILLRLDSTVILVDTGEADDYPVISRKLTEYGIQKIDYLIISHYDNDHIGTMSQILQNYTVGNVYMPDYVRDSSLYRRMMTALEGVTGVTVHRPAEDVRIDLPYGSLWINPTALYEPGVTLGSDEAHALEENNYSLITSVYFGDVSMLLAGDAEQDRITEVMDVAEKLNCAMTYDVIKIPHHGGYDSALHKLFDQNKGERYCMVHVSTKDSSVLKSSLETAMRTSGAAAKFTCNGTIAFATDGVSMTAEQN